MKERASEQIPLQLRKEDIKVEKDCTHLIPPRDSYSIEEYERIVEEAVSISVDTPKKILEEIIDKLDKEIYQIRPYAGAAFLSGDEEEMKFWKGQYVGLERIRKFVKEKRLVMLVEGKKGKNKNE